MPRRRDAVLAHGYATGRRDFRGHFRGRQNAAVARLGALAELDLDHLDLLIARIDLKEVGIEAAVRIAAAKIARAYLPDQVTTVRAVMLRDRALTRVMRKTAALGAGVQGQNRIG